MNHYYKLHTKVRNSSSVRSWRIYVQRPYLILQQQATYTQPMQLLLRSTSFPVVITAYTPAVVNIVSPWLSKTTYSRYLAANGLGIADNGDTLSNSYCASEPRSRRGGCCSPYNEHIITGGIQIT